MSEKMFFLDFLDRRSLPLVANGLSAEGGIGLWRQTTESDDSKNKEKTLFSYGSNLGDSSQSSEQRTNLLPTMRWLRFGNGMAMISAFRQ